MYSQFLKDVLNWPQQETDYLVERGRFEEQIENLNRENGSLKAKLQITQQALVGSAREHSL